MLKIAIANRKGGTGKTTTAVNLAACLASSGERVLLVDLDTQGHAGLSYDVLAARGEPTAQSVVSSGSGDLSIAIRSTAVTGVDLVPASRTVEPVESPRDMDVLKQALAAEGIADKYSVVIIDTAPALDAFLVNVLAAVDAVVIPFLPHPLALDGVRQFAKALFFARTAVNPALSSVALVPVQLNPAVKIHRDVVDRLCAEFGRDKLFPAIRSDIKLAEASGAGKPIMEYMRSSRGTQDYMALATRIKQDWLGNSAARLVPAPSSHGAADNG